MTIATITETPTETIPDFDRTDGDEIADEMLMESAGNAKVGRVTGGVSQFRGVTIEQSAQSRAWTKRGNVD